MNISKVVAADIGWHLAARGSSLVKGGRSLVVRLAGRATRFAAMEKAILEDFVAEARARPDATTEHAHSAIHDAQHVP